jgi:histone acetyltransferase
LWALKILYEKQLPKIPKCYISKFILNRNHESIIIKKFVGKKFHIIGGCSFRFFKQQQLLELVFFAIKTKEQIKGYGTFLILVLKNYANFLGLKFIITCADNNAMHFFFKQGFSPFITLPSFFWSGFVRDYIDIVLMEFVIFSKFNYLNVLYLILSQKIFLNSQIKNLIGKNNLKIAKKKKFL